MTEAEPTQFVELRSEMVEQITHHAMHVAAHTGRPRISPEVLAVIGEIPRHEFVPVELRSLAYFDTPLPIGCEKTISQPFIVALMTDLLELQPGDRVLEIGTGLGYQTAILARLAGKVYSMEIIPELGESAARRLGELGVANVQLAIGDGSGGWPEHAPFDKIIVTAAPDLIPPSLLHQLARGGRMVIPAGIPSAQQLMLVTRDAQGRLDTEEVLAVRFSELSMGE